MSKHETHPEPIETGRHGSGKLGKAHHAEGDRSPLSGEVEHPNEPDTASVHLPAIKPPKSESPLGKTSHAKGDKFHSGDKVLYKSGATCYVQYMNEDGTYAVVTDDQKHAFNADVGDLELICVAAEATAEYQPPARREPIQDSAKGKPSYKEKKAAKSK